MGALDVWKGWFNPAQHQQWRDTFGDLGAGEELARACADPQKISALLGLVMSMPLGVYLGRDENDEAVLKTVLVVGITPEGGLTLFAGLEVKVGQVLELLSPGDGMSARTKV